MQKDVGYVNENKEKPIPKEQQNTPAHFPLDGMKSVGLGCEESETEVYQTKDEVEKAKQSLLRDRKQLEEFSVFDESQKRIAEKAN